MACSKHWLEEHTSVCLRWVETGLLDSEGNKVSLNVCEFLDEGALGKADQEQRNWEFSFMGRRKAKGRGVQAEIQ